MKLFFAILLSTVCSFCFGQSKADSYNIGIVFLPSFSSPSKLLIKNTPDSTFIDLTIQRKQGRNLIISDAAFVKKEDLAPLTDFLKTYDFPIKGKADTMALHKGPFFKGDTTTIYELYTGADGVNVYGLLDQNDTIKKFAFWSPKKDSDNYKLVDILFAIMDGGLKKKESRTYIKALKAYFN